MSDQESNLTPCIDASEPEEPLRLPEDVVLCGVCRQWVAMSEFRRRTDGGIAYDCRECHNHARAAQQRRARARRRHGEVREAIAAVNVSRSPSDLHAAATAILGVCGGLRGFARIFAEEFNQAPAGSQMRTSMLKAAISLFHQQAIENDADEAERKAESEAELEACSDTDLRAVIADALVDQ